MKEVILGDGEELHIVWEKDGVRTSVGTFSLMEQSGRPPCWVFVTDGDFPLRTSHLDIAEEAAYKGEGFGAGVAQR